MSNNLPLITKIDKLLTKRPNSLTPTTRLGSQLQKSEDTAKLMGPTGEERESTIFGTLYKSVV